MIEASSDLAVCLPANGSTRLAKPGAWCGVIESVRPHQILLVVDRPELPSSLSVIRSLRREYAEIPVLIALERGSSEKILELLHWGVADFLMPPLEKTDVLTRVRRYLKPLGLPRSRLIQGLKERLGLKQMVGESPAFVELIRKLPAIARSGATVLVSGETGTGKEICARAIHYLGPRSPSAFVPVNCGAIPVELVENELFGHEKSAYTGAASDSRGLIREAEGGTLFLDEIDSLPPMAQVKLLRFLQEKEYRPLGSSRARRSDLRIIAATNIDPEKAVQEGQLRRDLYYRVNVISLKMPPLRRRCDDIPLLARHFLSFYSRQFDKGNLAFSSDALQALCLFEWPGNVRELEHVVERAVVLAKGPILRAADLDIPNRSKTGPESFQEAKARVVSRFERAYIRDVLRSANGNISQAARLAQKNRRVFWELLRKHGIDADRFREQC